MTFDNSGWPETEYCVSYVVDGNLVMFIIASFFSRTRDSTIERTFERIMDEINIKGQLEM